VLESGDVLLFAVAPDGKLVAVSIDRPIPGLPDRAGIAAALGGRTDTRTMPLLGENVRVYTEPVTNDGQIVGAIQAVQSNRAHETELALVARASLAGIGLGALAAVPIGLFLARRAMRPINDTFARQRAFVADASHELRTPLAVIRANTELAQRLLPPASEVRDELQSVIGEVDQMSRLVDDLLFLARADAGTIRPVHEPLDLAAIVQSALEPMRNLARQAGLALTVETAGALPVAGDQDQLRRAVRILVDNAIRYTPTGGSIAVRADAVDGRATVRVRDTGVGISPEDQPRVFERFFRSDAARSRATGGVGLGLPIARTIVQEAGGRIGLTSEPGHGSEFWFTLPLTASPMPAPQAAATPAGATAAGTPVKAP
jgi:signal transduction histidine kinase